MFDETTVFRLAAVKTLVGIPLLDLQFFLRRLPDRKLARHLPDVFQIFRLVAVIRCRQDLKVVEGSRKLVHLQGQVPPLFVQNRVTGVHQVISVDVGHQLITDELNGHRVPPVRLERVRALAVPIRKVRPAFVQGRLQEEVIASNVNHRVVGPVATGDETDVSRLSELEVKPDHHIPVLSPLQENPRGRLRSFPSFQDSILRRPVSREGPARADLPGGEVIGKIEPARFSQQGRGGVAGPHGVAPRNQLRYQTVDNLGMLSRPIMPFGGIGRERKQLTLPRVEELNQLPVPITNGAS